MEPKLSDEQRKQVCAWIPEGWNAYRISEMLDEDYDIKVTPKTIHINYIKGKKWQGLIKKLSDILDKELMKHPLAKKENRLAILNKAINEAMTWRLDQIRYDKDGREVSRIEKRQVGTVASLVREARAEVEGEAPTTSSPIIIITSGDAESPTFPDKVEDPEDK